MSSRARRRSRSEPASRGLLGWWGGAAPREELTLWHGGGGGVRVLGGRSVASGWEAARGASVPTASPLPPGACCRPRGRGEAPLCGEVPVPPAAGGWPRDSALSASVSSACAAPSLRRAGSTP
eukprot:CAMPEP_0175765842 /NCGR_PEP_ID=MMETSP0097-20121207/69023_1 /TAXON_ID=311494 /ORGANISM="Alexandrium monilatum, Strain CCMP3105" /LENGTH=122 /DNA_ID=CAMNT_0017075739 /DNA_START=90 /DNA_END=454 /DNA_ORIENTATION=+